jgi:hypothetical protein
MEASIIKHTVRLLLMITLCVACGTVKSTKAEESEETPITTTVESESYAETPSFDYQPPKPKNGELFAVIEIGSLGLNYFIVEIDNALNWSLKKSRFGRSNLIYDLNSTDEIVKTVQAYYKEINRYGVKNQNIHIIASSSVVAFEDVISLNERLAAHELYIKPITVREEAKYALLATIPKEFIDESFVVDIGSGNTKLAWIFQNDTMSEEIHGSKYFLKEVQDTTVFREVRDAVLKVPEPNRNLCFMLGGMIYEFIKDKANESDNRYFILDPPSSYDVSSEKLRAASIIYNALYLEPTYSYIFDKESNFSIGYLVNVKNKKEQD